jgi:hypothetical protein
MDAKEFYKYSKPCIDAQITIYQSHPIQANIK